MQIGRSIVHWQLTMIHIFMHSTVNSERSQGVIDDLVTECLEHEATRVWPRRIRRITEYFIHEKCLQYIFMTFFLVHTIIR